MKGDPNKSKKLFAKLIGADNYTEVALVTNTSTGLNIVAHMLDYPKDSNVVTTFTFFLTSSRLLIPITIVSTKSIWAIDLMDN